MDFTGVGSGTLSFNWASFNHFTGDRKGSLRVYYSTNGTSFTELVAAQVLNFTNNVSTSGSISNVELPDAVNNSPTARLRFYYHNGVGGTFGSRPKISIDDLTVTSDAVLPGTSVSVQQVLMLPNRQQMAHSLVIHLLLLLLEASMLHIPLQALQLQALIIPIPRRAQLPLQKAPLP